MTPPWEWSPTTSDTSSAASISSSGSSSCFSITPDSSPAEIGGKHPPIRAYAEGMANKAPAKPQTKKTGKSLQEKRAAKQAKKSEKKGGSSS